MSNPLVAASVDTSTPFQGTFLLEDGEQLVAAIKSGDWVSGGMAALSAVLDTAATVSDPLGSLVAAGLGWLMEHLEPLKGWMNDLTGDAGEVAGFSGTWANVSTQMSTSADDLASYLADIDNLDGDAIEAYRAFQDDVEKHLRAAGSWADAMSIGLSIASTIVQIVHDIVRDAIAQIVGSIVSYAAELVLSVGLATPLIIEQVSTRVASLVTRVGKSVTRLLASGKELTRLLGELKVLFRDAGVLFDKVLKGDKSVPTKPHTDAPGTGKPPKPLSPEAAALRDKMVAWSERGGDGYNPTGDKSWDEFVDEYLLGFDADGHPIWKWPDGETYPHGFRPGEDLHTTLGPGDTIERIGIPGKDGDFAAPPGTEFNEKTLPPDRLDPTWETKTYRVKKAFPDEVDVREGPAAPGFEQPGGGTQYYFPKGIKAYIGEYLEEVTP